MELFVTFSFRIPQSPIFQYFTNDCYHIQRLISERLIINCQSSQSPSSSFNIKQSENDGHLFTQNLVTSWALWNRKTLSTGLTHHLVCTLSSLMSYIEEGTKARKTASTLQNPNSSRSHALLTVSLVPISQNGRSLSSPNAKKKEDWHCGNRLHLVDLAGSESAVTCGGIHRLKVSHILKISILSEILHQTCTITSCTCKNQCSPQFNIAIRAS